MARHPWDGAEHIPVTEASARGIARLAKDAENGEPVVITRHGRPVAAVIPIESGTRSRPRSETGRDSTTRESATQRWVRTLGATVAPPPITR
jgi:prevent-host-death family protein